MSIRLILFYGFLYYCRVMQLLKKWNVKNQLLFFVVDDMRTQWENKEIIIIFGGLGGHL